jgi:hypothetical protein
MSRRDRRGAWMAGRPQRWFDDGQWWGSRFEPPFMDTAWDGNKLWIATPETNDNVKRDDEMTVAKTYGSEAS